MAYYQTFVHFHCKKSHPSYKTYQRLFHWTRLKMVIRRHVSRRTETPRL